MLGTVSLSLSLPLCTHKKVHGFSSWQAPPSILREVANYLVSELVEAIIFGNENRYLVQSFSQPGFLDSYLLSFKTIKTLIAVMELVLR